MISQVLFMLCCCFSSSSIPFLSLSRDEQYRSLWTELENLTEAFSGSSDRHRQLFEIVSQAVAHSPSMQVARKTASIKSGIL